MGIIFDLITRLNELMKEQNELELKYIKSTKEYEIEKERLDTEYNEIVMRLWGHIPSLKDDVNIQPKKKVRVNKIAENGKKVQ